MIRLKDVTIRYPKVVAINNISFEFAPGVIYGLIGANGAGKTTLIRAIVGLIHDFEGQIYIGNDKDLWPRETLKNKIGFAPEDIHLFPYLSAREYLSFLSDIRKIAEPDNTIENLIELTGLQDVADDIVERYSHGMKKKLSLAGALIADPDYLILDEALNGLDPVTIHRMHIYLHEKAAAGKTIIMASHVLEMVENWCDAVLILNAGIIAGSYSQSEIKTWCKKNDKRFSDFFIELIQK